MTVHTVTVGLGILVSVLAILGALYKIGVFVLRSFHNENVVPALQTVTGVIERNTVATQQVATSLDITNRAARETQHENVETFQAIREMLSDHRAKLDVHETRLDGHDDAIAEAKAAPKRRTRRSA